MRDYILKHYIKLSPDSTIIGHHGSIHSSNFFVTWGLIIGIWLIYSLFQVFFPSISILTWICAGSALLVYFRFVIEFFNHYLDAIVINKQGISILEWNKILNYSVQHCHWDNIESISHSQHSLGDKIFNKGEVSIILDHGLHHHFQDISNPKQVAGLLRDNKVQFETKQATNLNTPDREHDHQHNEKFDILVETLGEVIKEYMDKDKTKNIPDRW